MSDRMCASSQSMAVEVQSMYRSHSCVLSWNDPNAASRILARCTRVNAPSSIFHDGGYTEYRDARHGEDIARLRRVVALRAMVSTGFSQRQIADMLGISQSAVSQQLRSAPDLEAVHPEQLLEAAAPVLTALAGERGYERLGVFGSVARSDARQDSDIDLIVKAPAGTSSFEFLSFKQLIEQVLGREVDMISYGGLLPTTGDDIRRDAMLL